MKRILIVLLLCTILCGCLNESYSVRVHQGLDDVIRIELLDTSQNEFVVLHTLKPEDHQTFWNDIHTLSFLRYYNDPSTEYGPLSIRIFYINGYIDLIGCDINGYYAPNGENEAHDGWYCVEDRQDFVDLFAKYINESTPPSIN